MKFLIYVVTLNFNEVMPFSSQNMAGAQLYVVWASSFCMFQCTYGLKKVKGYYVIFSFYYGCRKKSYPAELCNLSSTIVIKFGTHDQPVDVANIRF